MKNKKIYKMPRGRKVYKSSEIKKNQYFCKYCGYSSFSFTGVKLHGKTNHGIDFSKPQTMNETFIICDGCFHLMKDCKCRP